MTKNDRGADAAAVALAGSSDTSQLPHAIPDGGAAFPTLEVYARFNDDRGRYEEHYAPHGGMSLRDYFAAKALPEAIAHERELRGSQISPGAFRYDEIARAAYVMADAMLKQREGK